MFYEIRVPRTQERDPIAAPGLIQALIDTFGQDDIGDVLFLVRNGYENVASYLVSLPPRPIQPQNPKSEYVAIPVSEVESVVQRFYPEAIVEETYSSIPPIAGHHERWLRFIRPKNPFGVFNPILSVDRIQRDDPFALLAQLISQTPPDDCVYYGIHIISMRRDDFVMGAGTSFFLKALGGVFRPNPYQQHQWHSQINDIREAQQYKAAEGAYEVIPYVCYRSADKTKLQVAESIARIATHCGWGAIPFAHDFVFTDRVLRDEDDFKKDPMWFFVFNDADERHNGTRYSGEEDIYLLTPREIATLWHLPDETYLESAINWVEEVECRELPDPLKTLADGVLIGTNVSCDHNQTTYNVRLPIQERAMHTVIMGRVGTGKSALMHRMVHEDIQAGRPVVVIDPHGAHEEGLVRWILQHSIPDNRLDDVVVVDLTDMKNPPPINPLLSAGNPQLVAGDFVATLARVYEDTDLLNTRMADWLRLALRTIALNPNTVLSDVRTVFRDASYRRSLLEKTDQLSLLEDWDDFQKAEKVEATLGGILTRIRRFMERNETLAMVCHPKPLHYGQLAAQNKIILVSAGGGVSTLSYKERMALASVIVSQVMEAALCGLYRKDNPVTMYIDETRNFVNAPLDEMLREVRKFNLAMVMSSQGMSALTQKTQDAIDESVATFIGFEMSDHDADMFKPYIKDVYTTDELQTLGRFTAAVATRYKGERLRAFELKTFPPITTPNGKSREALVRQRSVENYMPMSYGEVLEAYKNRYANNPVSADTELDPDDFIKRT